eukprot:COSAG05_NODE_1093_length_5913_cov_38.151703_4_plen_77_part_00
MPPKKIKDPAEPSSSGGGAWRYRPIPERVPMRRPVTHFPKRKKITPMDWSGTGLSLLDQEPTLGGGVAGVNGRPRS